MNCAYYIVWYENDMSQLITVPFSEVPETLERIRTRDPHAHLYALDGSGAAVELTHRYPVVEVASV